MEEKKAKKTTKKATRKKSMASTKKDPAIKKLQDELDELKDQIATEIHSQVFSIHGKLIHVRVGTEDQPATPDVIADIEKKINSLLSDSDVDAMALVTHHAVAIDVY